MSPTSGLPLLCINWCLVKRSCHVNSYKWFVRQAYNLRYISKVQSNWNTDRASEKIMISDPMYTVLSRNSSFSKFTRTKGGGAAVESWHDDKGDGGGGLILSRKIPWFCWSLTGPWASTELLVPKCQVTPKGPLSPFWKANSYLQSWQSFSDIFQRTLTRRLQFQLIYSRPHVKYQHVCLMCTHVSCYFLSTG